MEKIQSILKCHIKYQPVTEKEVSLQADALMKKLLTKNPAKRLSATKALRNQWFRIQLGTSEAKDLVKTTITGPSTTGMTHFADFESACVQYQADEPPQNGMQCDPDQAFNQIQIQPKIRRSLSEELRNS